MIKPPKYPIVRGYFRNNLAIFVSDPLDFLVQVPLCFEEIVQSWALATCPGDVFGNLAQSEVPVEPIFDDVKGLEPPVLGVVGWVDQIWGNVMGWIL